MELSELLELFRALAATYDTAVRRLGCRDLRIFFLHEAQWLQHSGIDAELAIKDLYQLRVDEAASFLKTLLEVTKAPAAPRRRRRGNVVPLPDQLT